MGSFGERMQREREMRGITLEEISEATKISSRCLRALEKEEFDKLPGGIFNKGFVRAYARHLGIDEDQAVADFVVASGGEKEQPLPDPPVTRALALGQASNELPNWRAFVLLLVLIAIVIASLWKVAPLAFYSASEALTARLKPKPARPPAPPPGIAPQSASEVATPAPVPAAPPVQKKPVAKAQPLTVAASAPATAPVATPEPAAVPPAESAAPARTFVVQVRATQDAWVQIVADGKLLSEGVLVPPGEKRVRAAKEVTIKTGNAAGVEVMFNGQPLPPLGDVNQVATVTLTAGGVQR